MVENIASTGHFIKAEGISPRLNETERLGDLNDDLVDQPSRDDTSPSVQQRLAQYETHRNEQPTFKVLKKRQGMNPGIVQIHHPTGVRGDVYLSKIEGI